MRRSPLIAAHEAGHAVVAVALGVHVYAVRLTPHSTDTFGFASVEECPRSRRLHDALVSAAGPAADALSGRYKPSAAKRPPTIWAYDYADIRACGFSCAERLVLIQMATRMLTGECAAPWRELTAALLERDLNGDDVRAICLHGARAADFSP